MSPTGEAKRTLGDGLRRWAAELRRRIGRVLEDGAVEGRRLQPAVVPLPGRRSRR